MSQKLGCCSVLCISGASSPSYSEDKPFLGAGMTKCMPSVLLVEVTSSTSERAFDDWTSTPKLRRGAFCVASACRLHQAQLR